MGEKYCCRCTHTKPLAEFGTDNQKADGKTTYCLPCRRQITRASDAKRRDKRLAYNTVHKARRDAQMREWLAGNKERVAASKKRWCEVHKERHRANTRAAMSRKRATAKGKLENNISRAISRGVKKGSKRGRRAFDLLGFSVDDLRHHLEQQFKPGMTWENYGRWHIDHVVPLAHHVYETPDDEGFSRAWALSNLQPLWAAENVSKGARYCGPFRGSEQCQTLA